MKILGYQLNYSLTNRAEILGLGCHSQKSNKGRV